MKQYQNKLKSLLLYQRKNLNKTFEWKVFLNIKLQKALSIKKDWTPSKVLR